MHATVPNWLPRHLKKTLETIRNDGFALAGLVETYLGMDERNKAQEAYSQLLNVWSRADPGLKWLAHAKAAAEQAGLDPVPKDVSLASQRTYDPGKLTSVGPSEWRPNPAPGLEVINSEEEKVTLDDYRGKTVVLVFAASANCESCLSGLAKLAEKAEELEKKNTVVVAVTPDDPELLARVKEEQELPFALLSDPQWKSGKRFKSYDEFEEIRLNSTVLVDGPGWCPLGEIWGQTPRGRKQASRTDRHRQSIREDRVE